MIYLDCLHWGWIFCQIFQTKLDIVRKKSVCYPDKLNFKSFSTFLMTKSLKMKSLKELKVTLNQEDYMVKNSLEHCLSKCSYKSALEKNCKFYWRGKSYQLWSNDIGLWKVQVVPDYKVTDLFRQHAASSLHFQLSFKLYSTSA